jgi:hypothetical protein
MAANKRTKLERERDLERISQAYLRGKTQQEMAQLFGVSQAQISYDLKVLQKRWLKSSLENITAAKAKELAKIDALERTYREAWERSCQDREVKTEEQTTAGKSSRSRILSRQEQRDGNPAFLAGIQWCIEQRCKIWGIAHEDVPPEPAAPTINVAIQQIIAGLTDEEKRVIMELRRKRLAAEQPA